MKVLYSALYNDSCHPFDQLCANTDVVIDPEELKERDSALIIWGGADINPAYYGHPMHSTTHPGGARDRSEWSLMQRAIELGIPIIGVCRGAQMACAAAGGYLIQDVNGHIGPHDVTTYDGETFRVNSIHHQMMCGLEKVDHELVAHSGRLSSRGYYGYRADEVFFPPEGWVEPEFVYFKKIRAYAIQWHPEMMDASRPATQYILNYIKRTESAYHTNPGVINCGC